MLRAKYVRCYKKATEEGKSRTVFVYAVAGKPDALAAYKAAQGDHFVADDETGEPLHFTVDFYGEVAELIITSKGRVVQNTEEYDKMASTVAQSGGDLGAEIAKIAAQKLMGVLPLLAPVAPTAPDAPEPEA